MNISNDFDVAGVLKSKEQFEYVAKLVENKVQPNHGVFPVEYLSIFDNIVRQYNEEYDEKGRAFERNLEDYGTITLELEINAIKEALLHYRDTRNLSKVLLPLIWRLIATVHNTSQL